MCQGRLAFEWWEWKQNWHALCAWIKTKFSIVHYNFPFHNQICLTAWKSTTTKKMAIWILFMIRYKRPGNGGKYSQFSHPYWQQSNWGARLIQEFNVFNWLIHLPDKIPFRFDLNLKKKKKKTSWFHAMQFAGIFEFNWRGKMCSWWVMFAEQKQETRVCHIDWSNIVARHWYPVYFNSSMNELWMNEIVERTFWKRINWKFLNFCLDAIRFDTTRPI